MPHFPTNDEPAQDPDGTYLTLRLDFDKPSTRTERLSARFAAQSWAEDVLWSGSVRLRPMAEGVLKWLNETRGE
jgi:hypothetical protein